MWFRMQPPFRTAVQRPFPERWNSFGEDGPGMTRWVLESDGFMTEVAERRCIADWNPMTRSSLIIPLDINPPSPKGRSVSWSFPRSRHHQPDLGPKTALGSKVDRSGAKTMVPMRSHRVGDSASRRASAVERTTSEGTRMRLWRHQRALRLVAGGTPPPLRTSERHVSEEMGRTDGVTPGHPVPLSCSSMRDAGKRRIGAIRRRGTVSGSTGGC